MYAVMAWIRDNRWQGLDEIDEDLNISEFLPVVLSPQLQNQNYAPNQR